LFIVFGIVFFVTVC